MMPRRRTSKAAEKTNERDGALKTRKRRVPQIKIRISLLPGILTTVNVLCGFYAVVWVLKGKFFPAAVAIIVAAGVDALDGRVARLTKTTSEFGVEFDSLADVVSFGIAPALLSYSWAFSSFGRLGWVVAFAYLICAVLRLARFNTRCKTVEPKYFLGLPTPAAGLFVATSVTLLDGEAPGSFFKGLFFLMLLLVSYLMVSNIRYRSFKELDFAKMHPFGTMTIVVVIVIIIASLPDTTPFLIVLTYLAWGVCESLWLKRREKRAGGVREETE